MTYLASSATLWITRAHQAWGTSRQWGVGSSFETDLAAMTTDRNNWQSSSNTWQSRANQAWGSSRVWNSGSSFETDLSNMTATANTWQSRANQAWGPSRVWNSGESWEQAYNRVLPPASVIVGRFSGASPLVYSGSAIQSSLGTVQNDSAAFYANDGMAVTLLKAGWYAVNATMSTSGNTVDLQIRLNGAGFMSIQSDTGSGGRASVPDLPHGAGIVQVAAGAKLTMWYRSLQGSFGQSSEMRVIFIPTQAYPH